MMGAGGRREMKEVKDGIMNRNYCMNGWNSEEMGIACRVVVISS